jgi:hypothetical protein
LAFTISISKVKVKNNSHKTIVLYFKSGAIMGVVAYTASSSPEARLNLIFLPAFSFSADSVSYYLKYL